MKVLVVLCAVACALAKPGHVGLAGPLVGSLGIVGRISAPYAAAPAVPLGALGVPAIASAHSVASPLGIAASPLGIAASPLALGNSYAAGPIAIGAPSVVAARTVVSAPAYAAAPISVAAPAVVSHAAPVAVAHAAPVAVAHAVPVAVAHAAPVAVAHAAPAVTQTRYHAQNEHGEASYGHSEPLQTHNAVQDAHGNKVGSFSYLNPHDGQVHRTDYVADAHGYRVAANDLPVAAVAAPVHAIHKRSAILAATPLLTHTPGSTALLGRAVVAAPVVHAAPYAIAAPALPAAVLPNAAISSYAVSHAAPIAVAHGAPLAVAGHGIPATLTTITNNPGHAVSYRID